MMHYKTALLCLVFCILSGCNSTEPVASQVTDATPAKAVPPKNPLELLQQAAAKKAEEVEELVDLAALEAESEVDTPEDSEYEPPFPGRTNLFNPPTNFSTRRKNDSQEESESVVLLGFADIDAPMALLEINGTVTQLGSGQEKFGVRVISIAPPTTVLQRGRTRWTASIE